MKKPNKKAISEMVEKILGRHPDQVKRDKQIISFIENYVVNNPNGNVSELAAKLCVEFDLINPFN